MNTLSIVLISLYLLTAAAVLGILVFGKREGCRYRDIFMSGSVIYKDIGTFIKDNLVTPFKVLSNVSLLLFVLFLVSIFI